MDVDTNLTEAIHVSFTGRRRVAVSESGGAGVPPVLRENYRLVGGESGGEPPETWTGEDHRQQQHSHQERWRTPNFQSQPRRYCAVPPRKTLDSQRPGHY